MATLNSSPHKQTETDLEMLIRIGKKFLILIVFISLFDFIIDTTSSVFHVLVEVLHLFIEFIEKNIEELIEHLLYYEHHEAEILIANAVILIGLVIFVTLSFKIYRLSKKIKRNLKAIYLKRRHQQKCNWHALSLGRKIKIILTYSFCCGLVLLTL